MFNMFFISFTILVLTFSSLVFEEYILLINDTIASSERKYK